MLAAIPEKYPAEICSIFKTTAGEPRVTAGEAGEPRLAIALVRHVSGLLRNNKKKFGTLSFAVN